MDDKVLGLDIARIIKAKPGQVFDAFTQPEKLKEWWGPEGFSLPKAEIEPKPGGAYAFQMKSPEGRIHDLRGTFHEVEPGRRLAYSWTWYDEGKPGLETQVALEFNAKGDGTEVRLRHTGFATETAAKEHEMGWSSGLNRLERMF